MAWAVPIRFPVAALLIGVLCLVACAAYGQQPRRIGVLLASSQPQELMPQALLRGLLDAGYQETRDLAIEWRSASGDYSRLPQLASELIASKPAVIVVDSTPGALALKRATPTIPIVMTSLVDPVGTGLVGSLAHPGGNITGLTIMTSEVGVKRLQLLKEAMPHLTRIAVLWNPDNDYNWNIAEKLKPVIASHSLTLRLIEMRNPGDLQRAVRDATRSHSQALYVVEDSMLYTHRAQIIQVAAKARLFTVWGQKASAEAGGLMSYGPHFPDLYRRAAEYVDKILRGAKPAELPIEQPTKFELVLNLKTARALGIAIPNSFQIQADEVIR